ncbi:hypothetical protein QE418_003384 [Microbacterium testaceum]|uniref:hypothetical protein n=1 Tax=Microbacterium TaxID=33882 RepID=UPI00277FC569|nr:MULTISPECIES: hypothetical protein [Microbacterium]MDQ1113936.1 hypothetical protein [Microbacterium testaceum]MDR6098957.1 hypothetical protein [Microbacterium sp. SORGH_AS_0454]
MTTTLPDVSVDEIPKHYAGELDDLPPAFLEARLGEVVDMIADRHGSMVSARLTSGRLTIRRYEAIVVRVAARVFGNPDGFTEETGGQVNYRFNPLAASGTIWLSDDDVYDLTGVHPNPDRSNVLGTASVGRHYRGRGHKR